MLITLAALSLCRSIRSYNSFCLMTVNKQHMSLNRDFEWSYLDKYAGVIGVDEAGNEHHYLHYKK